MVEKNEEFIEKLNFWFKYDSTEFKIGSQENVYPYNVFPLRRFGSRPSISNNFCKQLSSCKYL